MKKFLKHGKTPLAFLLVILAIGIAASVFYVQHETELERLQEEALAELERNIGQYDEQSIVLYETSKSMAEELAATLNAELRITENGRFAQLTLPDGVNIRDVYADDSMREHLDKMSADYQVHVSETEETPALLASRPQYTVTDTDYALQTYLDYLNMRDAWNVSTGSGVTVAVIDTGIDTDHPEFAGRISEYSYNATEDKIVKDWVLEDGSYDWSLIEDEVGHGTAVAGVIAASMNSEHVVGVAPDVTVIVIKAECNENGTFKRTSDLVFGLYYAIERDVDAVNMSFGTCSPTNPFAEATQLAVDSDIICVAAAGNEGTSALCWPAADENVIGVGALASDSWELAEYSNYGENTDLVAPGSTYTSLMGGTYGTMNGTSLAAPVVTGGIALYLQNNRYQTFDTVTEILYASCRDLGALGRDWDYGFGALDLSAFLLEERGTVAFEMLTEELDDMEMTFIEGHTLQELPEPERLYAVFDGWYYDDTFTQEYTYYEDRFYGEVTLYAKWVNEDDGIPFTYVELEDGTIEIRSYTGHRRYITIPDTIEGKTVSSIGDFAFSGETRLREVTLPSGLTAIKRYAFEGCSNLVWIEIPEGVTAIGEYAFYDNVRLSSVAFCGNSSLQTVGVYAFAHCGKLERIELPAALTNIDATAFYGDIALTTIGVQSGNTCFVSADGVLYNASCSTLVAYPAARGSSYTVSETATTVAPYAFAYARLDSIDLAAVRSIGASAFIGATLESLVIPDTVASLGDGVFAYNAELSSLTIGNGLTVIPEAAFTGCASLKAVEIPSGIAEIQYEAFSCSGLTRVTFAENGSLLLIGNSAFANCPLSEVEIPASVTTIDGYAFYNCPLARVTFAEGSNLHAIGVKAFAMCPLTEIDLPSELQSIGELAFAFNKLTAVTVPASVTALGDGAFAYCTDLPAIAVEEGNTVYHAPDGIVYTLDNATVCAYPAGNPQSMYALAETTREIRPYSFAGTAYLFHVTVPEGLEVIGEYAFIDCGAQTYTLPSTLINIMQYAFYRNSNLTNIDIPDNVLQIGRYAFAEDLSMSSATIGENTKMTRLGFAAFAECGITSFTVPANISTMAQYVFTGCVNLQTVTFAENSKLESLSAYVFDGCTSLQSLTFGAGSALTSVQAHGLEGMTSLQAVDLSGTALTNIDNFAFRFCESLTTVTLPETVQNVGRYAFYGCSSLSELALPETVEHIGGYAFLGTNELDLYLASESMPAYLDENWDHGIRGYYTGVTSVAESGDYRYAVLKSGNLAIIEYLGTDTAVDLTAVDLGAPITVIGGGAFKDCTVTAVILPETLTAIQAEAFQYDALESVTIPASVNFIGREAFAHTDIRSLTFEGGSCLTVIEQYAFEGTEYLTSVTLPNSVTTLGTGVFAESGLTSVAFAEGTVLTEIPQKAFMGTKLTAVSLPDSVTTVNHSAFRDILTLKTVTFGNNDGIRLMSNVFYNTGLESLHIPANVTYIGEFCFVGLEQLTAFTVDANNPNYTAVDGLLLTKSGRKLIAVPAGRTGSLAVPLSVEEIGFGAFENTALSEVLFDGNANILSLGYRAFFGAKNLTELTVPASVVSIDYYAFAYCENLQTVVFADGSNLKGIYEGAFCGDIRLENIVIPDSIVEISDFAFFGCSRIEKLPISENSTVKGIYDYAFAYTAIGGDFTTPETLVDIGSYAFLGTDITSLTVPDTQKKQLIIGIGAFEDCDLLTSVTLPFIGASYEDEKISWFGYIFGAGAYTANETYVPASLKTVTITEGITTVYTGGFYSCNGLETIHVPHSVSVLWQCAFGGTSAKYELTNTITTYWFDEYYTKLVYKTATRTHFGTGLSGSLTLADGVTGIGDSAFSQCSSLTSITIPASVTSIGWNAFEVCSGLYEIYNNSSLNLTIGSEEYGFVAYYARIIVAQDGTVTYVEDGKTYLETEDQFLFSYEERTDTYTLIAYLGNEQTITLPPDINGSAYAIYEFRGGVNVIIPDSVTSIGNSAFSGCSSLTGIEIPDGVTSIGNSAFSGCTALYENPAYYRNGMLVIDGWLISVDADTRHLTDVSEIKCAVPGAYYGGCDLLKEIVWDSGFTLPANVETIYINCINSATWSLYNTITLKNIIISDSVSAADLRYCSNLFSGVTGLTIYVEALEEDLCWDDNFPGWSNGNRVFYGDDWNLVTFYDENGEILRTEPVLNSQIIIRPVYRVESDEEYDYSFQGWDIDGDGELDSVPATTASSISAYPVVKKSEHAYGEWEVITEPTCTAAGKASRTCSHCGRTEMSTLPALNHSMGDWYTVTAPTCTEDGAERRDCTNCDHFETNTISALGHDLISHDGKAPTCTESGWAAYETCSRCDHTTYAELPAGNHSMGEWYTVTAPTCTASGEERRDCSNCDHYETNTIAALGHDYQNGTCTQCGEKDPNAAKVMLGDINSDGRINALDYILLKRYVLKTTKLNAEQLLAADINLDGKVNAADYILLKRHVLGTYKIKQS